MVDLERVGSLRRATGRASSEIKSLPSLLVRLVTFACEPIIAIPCLCLIENSFLKSFAKSVLFVYFNELLQVM